MEITRRSFINSIGVATAFSVAGVNLTTVLAQKKNRDGLFLIPPEVYSEPLYSMTAKQFEVYIGNLFTVTDRDGRSVQLVLTEVNVLDQSGNTIRGYYGECFSLIFEGAGRRGLDQNTYEMRTDGLANFDALLVPTGRAQRQYEVIANRVTR